MFELASNLTGTAVICFTMALPAHPLNAIRPGPSVDSEDPLYLYNSMLASVAKYQLAAQAAQSGKFSRQQVLDHICYDDLGCFFLNGTFGNFWTLPFGPELINTTFHLYTSAEQTEYETLSYTNINSLTESAFRGDLPTTILIHGFGNKPTDSWMEPFRRTIFHNVRISANGAHTAGLIEILHQKIPIGTDEPTPIRFILDSDCKRQTVEKLRW